MSLKATFDRYVLTSAIRGVTRWQGIRPAREEVEFLGGHVALRSSVFDQQRKHPEVVQSHN
jgi:hypothetical protein